MMGIFSGNFFDKTAIKTAINRVKQNLKFEGSTNYPIQPDVNRSFSFVIWEKKKPITIMNLIIPALSYRMSEPQRLTKVKTIGGTHIDDFGPDNKQIVIAGSLYEFYFGKVQYTDLRSANTDADHYRVGHQSDIVERDPDNVSPYGTRDWMSGRQAFYQLQDWVVRWKDYARKQNKELKDFRVEFYNHYDSEAYVVVIDDFTTTKSKDDPFSYQYELRMTEVGSVASPEIVALQDYPAKENILDLTAVISNGLNAVAGAITFFDEFVAPFKNIVTLVTNLKNLTLTPLINMMDGIENNTLDFLQVNYGQATSGFAKIDEINVQMQKSGIRKEDSVLPLEGNMIALREVLALMAFGANILPTVETKNNLGNIIDDNSNKNNGSGFTITDDMFPSNTDADIKSKSITIKQTNYVVKQGDTLESIALKYYGDGSQWYRISGANMVKPEDMPNLVGQTLKIPLGPVGNVRNDRRLIYEQPITDTQSYNTPDFYIKLLGRDLKINEEKKLIVENGDLSQVYGLPCLYQGMTLMMTIEQGKLNPYHTNYGFPAGLGRVMSDGMLKVFVQNLRKTYLYDTRIADVKDLRLRVDADQIFCDVTLKLAGVDDEINARLAT